MKSFPVPFLRARLVAIFLLSLAAVYGVGLAVSPVSSRRPLALWLPPVALALATLAGAALMDRLFTILDRAGRGRLRLIGWVTYAFVLLMVLLGILTGERGQQAVRMGGGVMRIAQGVFLLLAGLGRGYLGAVMNAFALTCVAVLGGGPAAAGAVALHAGLLVFFLVADHHARLLSDYPVDAAPEAGPILLRAAGLGAALAAGLALFFAIVPCAPYAPLMTRAGVHPALPQDQLWALVRDLVLLVIVSGLAFWGVLWLGGGRGRDPAAIPSRKVAAQRVTVPRPSSPPPPDLPDPQGWRARIVRLYVRLAEQLSRLGVRRRPAQTPREFAQALAPAGAAETLTDLFVRARYGDREPGEADFEAASSATAEILNHFRGRK